MKKNYLKFFFIILAFLITFLYASIWGYENPENIEKAKSYFKKNKIPKIIVEDSDVKEIPANSYSVEIKKIFSLSEKTAFIINENNFSEFNKSLIKIYTQNGYLIENSISKKLNLPKNFTLQRNGGLKNIFSYKKNLFAFISAFENNCYYGSVIYLKNSRELLKTKCLPFPAKKIDFNGIGSSSVHFNNNIYLSIGTPEQSSSEIASLAQNNNSLFGKIIEISGNDLDSFILNQEIKIKPKIYTKGHRNPQGLTIIKENLFSVEHGPKGGDELNKLVRDKNYGWPQVSFGTKYLYDNEGKSYSYNHNKSGFADPLFALVPSVGISSVNVCPSILNKFYKKPCLIALSLNGNNLRPGRSILIFLLNDDMNKVHSTEQIHIDMGLSLRHFLTSSKNELYEDNEGNIYVSADKKGIYKIKFKKFR